MAFHLGSLGFLTPFVFDNFQQQVTNALEGIVPLIDSMVMILWMLIICYSNSKYRQRCFDTSQSIKVHSKAKVNQ